MKTGTEGSETAAPVTHDNSEGLKSIRLELENFKKIDKKVVNINGKSLVILGKNESGKSSIIQAITSSLDVKQLPTEPIKTGEEHARISHTMAGTLGGEEVEYTIDIMFSPKNKKGRLKVTDKDGNDMKTPATLIKSLIGKPAIDPTKWLNDTNEKKLQTVKELAGCGKEVDMINIDIDNAKADMKTKNDRADGLAASIQNNGMSKEDIDKYSQPVDVTGIQSELNQIVGNQQKWDTFKQQVDAQRLEVTNSQAKILAAGSEVNRIHAEIQRMNTELARQQQIIKDQTEIADKANYNIGIGDAWLNKTPRPMIDEVNARLTLANEHNFKTQQIAFLASQSKEMMSLRNEADVIKTNVKKLETKRAEVIQKSQLPIKGMSFTEKDILIDGLPLEEGQINTATLIDVSVDVAIAMNPNYKVIFIHEGSLFDKEHLKAIVKRIEDKGYIAIIELVAETNELEIAFTEDYL
jgi:predicted ATP-dependent endonuclease of OLD family